MRPTTTFEPDPDTYLAVKDALARCRAKWGDIDEDLSEIGNRDRIWRKFRGKLHSSAVKAYVLEHSHGMHEIPRNVWATWSTDDVHFSGRITLTDHHGTELTGDVFVDKADLQILLEPPDVDQSRNTPAENTDTRAIATGQKRGRPPNSGHDDFWIEICRLIDNREMPEDRKVAIKMLTQWSSDRMKSPYDENTVRKKLSALWKALGWPD